jgi:serpin B
MTIRRVAFVFGLLLAVAIAGGAADGDDQQLRRSAAALDEVVQANNSFALDLYGRLRPERKRICFSPCSVFEALSMVRAGAGGLTAEQIEKALCFETPAIDLHAGLAEAVKGLQADSRRHGYQVSVRNALWRQDGSRLAEPFARSLKEHYKAADKKVDFIGDAAEAIRGINAEIRRRSGGRVKDFLSAGDVDQLTEVVLVNTVRLKVDTVDLAMGPRQYRPAAGAAAGSDDQSLPIQLASYSPEPSRELAMQQRALSLVLFLTVGPEDGKGAFGSGWQRPHRRVDLEQPVRKYRTQLSLENVLQEMKMTEAFSGSADLSGLNEDTGLYVSDVLHAAWLAETDDGTEATAATVVILNVVDPGALSMAW